MRYIGIDNIKEGMVLGKTLFNSGGQVLLTYNSLIKKEYIHRIKALGYAGVYIKDRFSEDIEIDEFISPEIKMATIKKLKDIYISESEKDKKELLKNVGDMKGIVSNIVDDIISNKEVMVNVIDLKVYDDYTYYHSINVAVLAVAIGAGIGLNRDTLNALGIAALLHDIGKKFVSKDILDKKGKLTDEEFEVIKEHSRNGFNYIKENFNLSSVSSVAILQHHERYNGSGYPFGKSKNNIPAFARILAVVDVYDALTSKRPYHEARLPHLAIEFMKENSGELFDPDVIKVFLKRIAPYPIGLEVELSNGKKGIVYKNYEEISHRPVVKVKLNEDEFEYLDLKNDENLKEVSIVKIAG